MSNYGIINTNLVLAFVTDGCVGDKPRGAKAKSADRLGSFTFNRVGLPFLNRALITLLEKGRVKFEKSCCNNGKRQRFACC